MIYKQLVRSAFIVVLLSLFAVFGLDKREVLAGGAELAILHQKRGVPNIVFILADDLGWTDIGIYGSDFHETPNLDRLALQGARFTNAYVTPLCSATRASILTGWAPARTKLTATAPTTIQGEPRIISWDSEPSFNNAPALRVGVPHQTEQLSSSLITVADRLRQAGYANGFFGKWHLGPDPTQYPEAFGFDFNVAGTSLGWPPTYFDPYRIPTLANRQAGEYLTDRLTDEAIIFIQESMAKNAPFFVYLSHYAVHGPWQAKPDDIRYFQDKLSQNPNTIHRNPVYAAMIKNLDENVGRVLDALDDLGIADETLVIFYSDDGGALRTGEGVPVTTPYPLRGGKGVIFEGGIRVPLLVRWPGVTEPGQVIHEPVICYDIFPTLEAVAGLTPLPNHPVDGRSLVPLLANEPFSREYLTWFFPHPIFNGPTADHPPAAAIRWNEFKLIKLFGEGYWLYNLEMDIGETTNIACEYPELVTVLNEKLMAELTAQRAFIPQLNPQFDERRALAYAADMRARHNYTAADVQNCLFYVDDSVLRDATLSRRPASISAITGGPSEYFETFDEDVLGLWIRPVNAANWGDVRQLAGRLVVQPDRFGGVDLDLQYWNAEFTMEIQVTSIPHDRPIMLYVRKGSGSVPWHGDAGYIVSLRPGGTVGISLTPDFNDLVASVDTDIDWTEAQRLKITVIDNSIEVRIADSGVFAEVLRYTDEQATYMGAGKFGVFSQNEVALANFSVRTLD